METKNVRRLIERWANETDDLNLRATLTKAAESCQDNYNVSETLYPILGTMLNLLVTANDRFKAIEATINRLSSVVNVVSMDPALHVNQIINFIPSKRTTEVTSVQPIPVKLCSTWKGEKYFQVQFGEDSYPIEWDSQMSLPHIWVEGFRIDLDIHWIECAELMIGMPEPARTRHQARHDGYNEGMRIAREKRGEGYNK